MFTNAFGEVIATLLTVNPVLADIPSASSILDTSNYTFQAITLGKDADGWNYHAHSVSTTQYIDGDSNNSASSYNDGKLVIINYGYDSPSGASSYVMSATEALFSATYSSIPGPPSPYDTRLEESSTSNTAISNYEYVDSVTDLGHYTNPSLDSNLSSIWNVIGGYCPSGSANDYILFSSNAGASTAFFDSGTLQGFLNERELVDKNGYIRFNTSALLASPTLADSRDGAYIFSGVDNTVSNAGLKVGIAIPYSDAATLAAFGGIKVVGVYCLDLQAMLDSGLTPPYEWDPLNNNWIYKLVCKSVIVDNALTHTDNPDNNTAGFTDLLARNLVLSGTIPYFGNIFPATNQDGPLISVSMDFK